MLLNSLPEGLSVETAILKFIYILNLTIQEALAKIISQFTCNGRL